MMGDLRKGGYRPSCMGGAFLHCGPEIRQITMLFHHLFLPWMSMHVADILT